jgi:hypothetical protein
MTVLFKQDRQRGAQRAVSEKCAQKIGRPLHDNVRFQTKCRAERRIKQKRK